MNQEDYSQISEMQRSYEDERDRNRMMSKSMASSVFDMNNQPNLIEYQLELDNILERIDHLLRGDVLKFDEKGNLTWIKADNEELIIFNEYGVQEILRILSMYLNRNTILSNYDEETINWKVLDFSRRLTNLIFRKYEKMFYFPDFDRCSDIFFTDIEKGVYELDEYKDNPYKIKLKILEIQHDVLLEKIKVYEMLVGEMVDQVHSSYLRAYNGGERESLRSARMVTQNDNMNLNPNQQQGSNNFKWYKPQTWIN